MSLSGKNLTDETCILGTTSIPFGTLFANPQFGGDLPFSPSHMAWLNEPRACSVTVRYSF